MVPMRYNMWAGLFVLAATMGRRIYIDHEHYQIRPSFYVTFVGRQAMRKSTAKDAAKDLFTESFPDYPVGASVMSREQIVTRMSKDEAMRTYMDENGELIEWRPMVFFINELKNFMSINPATMVEFLTDIYDTKFFNSDTIKHGLQPIINPCINILACETPKWVVEKLKLNIIAGGFSRRMLFIYEVKRPGKVTFPQKTKQAHLSEAWCKTHLQKIVKIAGKFNWTMESKDYLDAWFQGLPQIQDEIIEGFYESKDVLVSKVAMLLAMAQPEPELLITKELLISAISFIESIEDNLPKLTVAVGRNELAVPQQKLLQMLEDCNGWIPEKEFHRVASQDLSEFEYASMKRFLKDTDQLFEVFFDFKGIKQMIVTNADKYNALKKSGGIVDK